MEKKHDSMEPIIDLIWSIEELDDSIDKAADMLPVPKCGSCTSYCNGCSCIVSTYSKPV